MDTRSDNTRSLNFWPIDAYRSGKDDVVNRNEYKLDEVADDTHDSKTHNASLKNFHVFCVVWLLALLVEVDGVFDECVNLSSNVFVLLLLISAIDHLEAICRHYN